MGILDEITKTRLFLRLSWSYDEKPTDRPDGSYYLDHMPLTGIPYWSESDDYFRARIQKQLNKQ